MGVLEGFDRVVFRGTLSSIAYPQGMGAFIGSLKVLYKDYGRFAQDLSERLKAHARAVARRQGRPFEYVAAPSASKEQMGRRMTRAGIGHGRRENCFARIDDLPRAQEMIDELERLNWPRVLDGFAKRANALLGDGKLRLRGYYWTIRESEYATDVMFKNAARLKAVYPHLVDHAMKRL